MYLHPSGGLYKGAKMAEIFYQMLLAPRSEIPDAAKPHFDLGLFTLPQADALVAHFGLLASQQHTTFPVEINNVIDAWASPEYVAWLLPSQGIPAMKFGAEGPEEVPAHEDPRTY